MTTMTAKKIKLSTGQEVTVGQISWTAWKHVKASLSKLLTGPVAGSISELIGGPAQELLGEVLADGDRYWTADEWAKILPELSRTLQSSLPTLVQAAFKFLEDLNPDLTVGCVDAGDQGDKGIDLDTLSAVDVIAIREAATDVNDFAALLSAEKNLLAVMAGQIQEMIGSSRTNSVSPGGSDSNTSLPQNTDGAEKPSEELQPVR